MRKILVLLSLCGILPHGVHAAAEADVGADAGKERHELLLDESIEQLMPVSPQNVQKFIQKRDAIEAVIEPGPAQMRTNTRQIAATPGAVPQVIRLTQGYSSTILFQDATGSPWPILTTILGSPKAFQAVQPKADGEEDARKNVHSNIINIAPLTSHASSNLVVTLEGAAYPVILQLLTDSAAKPSRTSDSLVVFRLNKPGPNADIPKVGPSAPTTITAEHLSFVHAVPPPGANLLQTAPRLPSLSVWEFKGQYYLRSAYPAVWPAWSSVASGEDIRVYVMPKAPLLVVSVNGAHIKIRVGKPGTGEKP